MGITNWSDYGELLSGLREQRAHWDGAASFEAFDSSLRDKCPHLVGGGPGAAGADEHGYEALLAEFRADGYDDELTYQQIRLAALAVPATQLWGEGAGWDGFYVSELPGSRIVVCEHQYAPPESWREVEQAAAVLGDGQGEAAAPDRADGRTGESASQDAHEPALGEQVLDPEENRWMRRSPDDGQYEYFHNGDGVWERKHESQWFRYHADSQGWLRYDEGSRTWLYDNQWLTYEQVAAPSVGPRDQEKAGESVAAPAEAERKQQADEDPFAQFLSLVAQSAPEAMDAVPLEDLIEMAKSALKETTT